MGDLTSSLFLGRVVHQRVEGCRNGFSYGTYYVGLPLDQLNALPFPVDRWGVISFHRKDHGPKDGTSLQAWARDVLKAKGLGEFQGRILLFCMPRVLGYVFNPVSFWFCLDTSGRTRAVIAEVCNTFGESHVYVCSKPAQNSLSPDDILRGEKHFHVSPFFDRTGHYDFQFHLTQKMLDVRILYKGDDSKLRLFTQLKGALFPLTRLRLLKAFVMYPLITGKTIFLIHWQALKLYLKKMTFYPKPPQKKERITTAFEIKRDKKRKQG